MKFILNNLDNKKIQKGILKNREFRKDYAIVLFEMKIKNYLKVLKNKS